MTVVDCLKEFPDRLHSGVIALVGAFQASSVLIEISIEEPA
jgi:hypothetical protein